MGYRADERGAIGATSTTSTFALELADLADTITMARYRAEDLAVETKPDLTPVSEADRAVEPERTAPAIAECGRTATVMGEEYGWPRKPVATHPRGAGSSTRSTGPKTMSARMPV